MRYLILIYENEATTPQDEAEFGRWFEYTERLKASGCYVDGKALQPTSTATTVRKQGDRVLMTDGPFAETREQLGGFYLIEAADLDAAIELAKKCPSGHVEVRPVMDTSGE